MTNRRGFLKSLMGAGAAMPAVFMGVDTAYGKSLTALNFTCPCGRGLVARVPEEHGDEVKAECECGAKIVLTWKGDHFDTKVEGMPNEFKADQEDGFAAARDALTDRV